MSATKRIGNERISAEEVRGASREASREIWSRVAELPPAERVAEAQRLIRLGCYSAAPECVAVLAAVSPAIQEKTAARLREKRIRDVLTRCPAGELAGNLPLLRVFMADLRAFFDLPRET